MAISKRVEYRRQMNKIRIEEHDGIQRKTKETRRSMAVLLIGMTVENKSNKSADKVRNRLRAQRLDNQPLIRPTGTTAWQDRDHTRRRR